MTTVLGRELAREIPRAPGGGVNGLRQKLVETPGTHKNFEGGRGCAAWGCYILPQRRRVYIRSVQQFCRAGNSFTSEASRQVRRQAGGNACASHAFCQQKYVGGSGPAYIFLLAECMARAGVAAGLPPDLATRLACETVAGSAELLHRSDIDAATLRQNVSSPGGTTAAALEVLMGPGGFDQLLTQAIDAATRRSRDLAG